ncbi:MAG: hypothetical protein A4E32_01073 [Methanomassiliicoccales archaeon PtaU1.Bin124]|nr:MAG: hypothetical protein A4E32_01073 [Methanomassiliicoccales archaeon PtaU1.Bin124]
MADDFVKQLQLSKQIEQKAKEATKNRKAAEEKMAKAEDALSKAKASAIDTTEAERLFTEAGAAFKDKDYKNALALATKSMDASQGAQRAKVNEMLATTQASLDILQKRNVQITNITSSLEHAKQLRDGGSLEEATAAARDAWDKTEQLANRTVAETFSSAQAKLATLKANGLTVESEEAQLERARSSLDDGRFQESLEKIDACLDSLAALMADMFRQRADALQEMQALAVYGSYDFGKANERLEEAIRAKDAGDDDTALRELKVAEAENRKALGKGLTAYMSVVKKRLGQLKDAGVDITTMNDRTAAIKEKIKEEEHREANSMLIATLDDMRKAEAQAFIAKAAGWNTKLRIAKSVGADLSSVGNEMDAAQKALAEGDLETAFAKIGASQKAVESSINGYEETVGQLEEYLHLLHRAEELGLNTSESAKTAMHARRAARSRDFQSSTSLLKDATRSLQGTLQAHYGKEVIRIEMTLATALRMQADVSDESEALDLLVNKIKRNEFGIVETELRQLSDLANLRLKERAERVVMDTRNAVDTYSGPMDLSEARASLRKAIEALEMKNYTSAYDLAKQATDVLKREEIQLLEVRLAEAGRLLTVMKELDCESITLKEKYHKALELKTGRNFGEAVKVTNEVLQFSASIIKDELTRQMNNAGKAVSISRKKGIGVSGPERLMEEAWRKLNANKIEESYSSMQQALDQLSQINKTHQETYDLIASVRTLLGEAAQRNLDVSKIELQLDKAQVLFEQDRYDEAKMAARMAHQEAERLAAPFVAPKRLAEATDLLSLAVRMKLETTRAEDMLAKAEDLLAVQDYLRALGSVKEAREQLSAIITEGLSRDINACKGTIERSRVAKMDMTTAEIVVQKAEVMLAEGRYNDSWRAVELAKSEVDQSTFMEQRATDQLKEAADGINDVSELGLDVATAKEVLNQASLFQKQGNFTLATELGKKAYGMAADAAEKHIKEHMAEAEERSQLIGLSGPDMASVASKKERILGLVTSRQFKEALFLIGPLEEEMRGLMQEREKAQLELNDLEGRAKALQEAGLFSDLAKQLLYRARERFQEGSFSESRSLVARCNEDLASITDMHESRQKELRSLQEEMAFIEDEGRRAGLKGLLDNADGALRKLDFERTSLFLRRARAALLEATGYEVGRYFEELMVLGKVMERAGIARPGGASKDGQFTKMYDIKPKDLVKLRDEVTSIRGQIDSDLKDRLLRLREELGRARSDRKETSASMKMLEDAETALTERRYEDVLDLIKEGTRSVGLSQKDVDAFNGRKGEIEASLAKLKDNGFDVSAEEAEMNRLADTFAREPTPTLLFLGTLGEKVERRMGEMLPDISIDIDFHDEPSYDHWAKVVFKLTNQGASGAKDLTLVLGGPAELRRPIAVASVAPGETINVNAEVLPKKKGTLTISLSLGCRSVMNDQNCGYDTEFEMQVE